MVHVSPARIELDRSRIYEHMFEEKGLSQIGSTAARIVLTPRTAIVFVLG
jgi:hypothetical protein